MRTDFRLHGCPATVIAKLSALSGLSHLEHMTSIRYGTQNCSLPDRCNVSSLGRRILPIEFGTMRWPRSLLLVMQWNFSVVNHGVCFKQSIIVITKAVHPHIWYFSCPPDLTNSGSIDAPEKITCLLK